MASKRKQLSAALEKFKGASARARLEMQDMEASIDEIVSLLVEPGEEPKAAKAKQVPSDLSSDEDEDWFWAFHHDYPGTKRSARTEFELFKTRNRADWRALCRTIALALTKHLAWRKAAAAIDEFVPELQHMQTVIRNKSWEAWELQKPPKAKHASRPRPKLT